MKSIVQNIRTHVAEDNLIRAIGLLIKHYEQQDSALINEALLLSRELYAIKKAVNTGVITWETGNRLRNKIAFHILEFIEEQQMDRLAA